MQRTQLELIILDLRVGFCPVWTSTVDETKTDSDRDGDKTEEEAATGTREYQRRRQQKRAPGQLLPSRVWGGGFCPRGGGGVWDLSPPGRVGREWHRWGPACSRRAELLSYNITLNRSDLVSR